MHLRLAPLLVACASAPAFAGGFHAISLPGSQLAALSADGRQAAGGLAGGTSGGFRWSEEKGAGIVPGAMSVRAISDSGRYVAGSSVDALGIEIATWWSGDGTAHPIGGLPGVDARAGILSIAYGVTDELKVVGTATDARHASVAFSWTPAAGMTALDEASIASGAAGVSRDGRRVFGWSARPDLLREGVLWRDGKPCCRQVETDFGSDLFGANRDVTMLFGIGRDASGREIPFAWKPGRPPLHASFDPPHPQQPLRVVAGSDDGAVAAGSAGSGAQRVAIVWTSEAGVERLDAHARRHGVEIPDGWTLIAATALSADGRRIGGFGLKDDRFDSFVIELPHPSEGPLAHSGTASQRRFPIGELP